MSSPSCRAYRRNLRHVCLPRARTPSDKQRVFHLQHTAPRRICKRPPPVTRPLCLKILDSPVDAFFLPPSPSYRRSYLSSSHKTSQWNPPRSPSSSSRSPASSAVPVRPRSRTTTIPHRPPRTTVEKESTGKRRSARLWEKTCWTTRTRPWRIARLAEQIADGFLATQALAVVLPRSALSSWTTLPVPSSVTSRVPVRFYRLCRPCASASVHVNH